MRFTQRICAAGWFVSLLWATAACTNQDIDPTLNGATATRGQADFTRYVAVGNSLTAGFADGGLSRRTQVNSYPNILAGQFKTVGGGEFVQPLFSDAQANGSGFLKLARVPASASLIELITATQLVPPGAARGGRSGAGQPLLTKFTEPNQNLGVPGIRVADLRTANYGSVQSGNEYFERLLLPNQAGSTTYLQYVQGNLANATFFTCWIGNNDVLGYALNGGNVPLTDVATFQTNFTALMDILTANGRKGAVVGIPNVLVAPYFNLITPALVLAQINATRPGQTPLTNLFIQTTEGTVRAATADDKLLLADVQTLARLLGNPTLGTGTGPYGFMASNPLDAKYILDRTEIQRVAARTAEFNALMKAQADARGLAWVDVTTLFGQLSGAGGLQIGQAAPFTPEFIRGGVFSLDGIHLTPAGYALAANEIIKAINAKYSATVPQVDATTYQRVLVQP